MKNLINSFKACNHALVGLTAMLILNFSPAMLLAGDTARNNLGFAQIGHHATPNPNDALFSVHYEMPEHEDLYFTITDGEGYVFFEQKFEGATYDKNFLFKGIDENVTIFLTFKTRQGQHLQQLELRK